MGNSPLVPYLRRLAAERKKLEEIHVERVQRLFRKEIAESKNTVVSENVINPVVSNKCYDLVYIVREGERNQDLRMSLRSVEKFCNYRKIWIIGYKPSWITGVEYIHTEQKGNKWQNSNNNYLVACNCPDISEDFILMNDDFFAIKPIINWKENVNVYLGNIGDEIQKYSKKDSKSRWQYAFDYANDLLDDMKCNTRYNYESHWPIMINKKTYLEFINRPEIIEFLKGRKVLHKRSIYRNLYPLENVENQKLIKDVKIPLNRDLTVDFLQESWLSVFDDVVDNWRKFPKLNGYLKIMFPNKSKFEND